MNWNCCLGYYFVNFKILYLEELLQNNLFILSFILFQISEYPSGHAARNLTLIAKTLQTLANFTKFGGKEHYMDFMNEFVEHEWDNMHRYLMKISTPPANNQRSSGENDWNISVDIGKEVSLLYSYLDELWTPEVFIFFIPISFLGMKLEVSIFFFNL